MKSDLIADLIREAHLTYGELLERVEVKGDYNVWFHFSQPYDDGSKHAVKSFLEYISPETDLMVGTKSQEPYIVTVFDKAAVLRLP